VKQEYGEREAIDLLERALSQGSAQAALALAQIKRFGELGQPRSPLDAMKYAYRAIELAVQTDSVPRENEPFPEVTAGQLLAEMARNNEAVDAAGRPLLTPDEVDRLERFYGAVEPATKQVKIRRLRVEFGCGSPQASFDSRGRRIVNEDERRRPETVWVWDWGRAESPTEFQFRNLERRSGCVNNEVLRRTLTDIYQQSKKSQVLFADLVEQKVKTAHGQAVENTARPERRRCRRRRC
jgi:hypothetical protein